MTDAQKYHEIYPLLLGAMFQERRDYGYAVYYFSEKGEVRELIFEDGSRVFAKVTRIGGYSGECQLPTKWELIDRIIERARKGPQVRKGTGA